MDVAAIRPPRLVFLAMGAIVTLSIGCSMFGPTTATSFLNKIEQSRDPNERYKAYEKLASDQCYDNDEQRARAVKVLIAGLDSKKEPVATRAVICRTLGILGNPAGRPSMVRLVRDPDVLVRTEACRSLGKLGRPEDATVLMQIMKLDENPDCKIAAIEAIGMLKSVDPRAPEYLLQEMEHSEDPAIRLSCLESLRKITGKDYGVKADAWRDALVKKGGDVGQPQAPAVARGAPIDRATTPASTDRRP